MQGLIRELRERARGTERARVVSDAVSTFALGLLLLAVGLVGTWGVMSPLLAIDRWWLVLPLAAICAVMLGKAHRPILALGAGLGIFAVDVLLGGSLGVMIALLDLIYSAALRARTPTVRRLEIGVAVCVPVGAAAIFVATGDLRLSVYAGLLVFALLGTPLWWGRSVRQQTELAGLASARAQDLARIGELREQEVVHAERTRMAGDLHDALASHLSAIAIHSEAALSGSSPTDAAAGRDRQALSAIRASSVAALREMRAMIDLLHTGDEARTSPARLAEVDVLVAGFRGQGMELTVSLPDEPSLLPAAVDQAAYRIIQEALANALKHGQGGPVDVTVRHEDDAVRIEVANAISPLPVGATRSGAGATDRHSGVGLLTMKERAEALGGSFSAGPQQDRWRVSALIPTEEPT